MLHSRSVALACAVLLVLLLPTRVQGQPAARIAGQVVSPSGTPLSGAEVALVTGDTGERTVVTGADGRFAFAAVPAGEYRLVASAVGYSPVLRPLRVPAADQVELSIALPRILSERVSVIGEAGADRIPGAVHVIDSHEMAKVKLATDDIHQMLRQVPGLNLQEEDGYGLRPNIGIRGTGSDRSSKITLMEDGVLIAPAPYAAPAAYFSPIAGRMEALEVRKGSSQIKYGPITTGGVVNYVTPGIPSEFRIDASVTGGQDSTRKGTALIGGSSTNVGWLVETFQFRNDGFKDLDGGGDTGVDLESYLGKLRFNSTPTPDRYHELELKVGRTEQVGDETYLGLTDADFARTPFRRYAASQEDLFESTHEQYQARYLVARRGWDLTTVAYRHNFQRAWYKLQSVIGAGLSSVLGAPAAHAERLAVLEGGDSAPDALVVRNNNRTYFGAGVQSVLGMRGSIGAVRHQLELGVRYHRDEEDRFQQDDAYQMQRGRMLLTHAGAPGSQTNQVAGARALAGFVADTISWGAWDLSPGLRYEHIDLVRDTYSLSDPGRVGTPAATETEVTAVIPGVGVSYALRPAVSIFGGIHRGFAPPGPGAAEDTQVEHSVNYELGTRLRRGTASGEIVGYVNDYGNLLGRDSLATGGTGSGDLFNGGRARVYGLEVATSWNLAERLGLVSALPVRVSYTLTAAEFRTSFDSRFGPWGSVQVGDELPYVPRHQVYASLETDHGRWRARVDTYYVGRMRTVAGQGAFLTGESTDGYGAVNLSGEYQLADAAAVFVSLQNAADNVYVVSRHPAGLRPGLPRLFQAGLRFSIAP